MKKRANEGETGKGGRGRGSTGNRNRGEEGTKMTRQAGKQKGEEIAEVRREWRERDAERRWEGRSA